MQAKSLGSAVVAAALLGHAGAFAQDAAARLGDRPLDELKSLYLECDRAAMRGLLDAGTAAYCSIAYETLKRRAFGGDFQRMHAWSRAQAPAPAQARPAGAQ